MGDWFLEFDAFAGSEAEYANVMASLTRVERAAWLTGVDTDDVVVPAEGEAFLQEAGQDVPMPEGVSVTVGDLRLPQDTYQARVAFVAPVLCGWAEQYAAGNDAALDRATRQRVLASHAGVGGERRRLRRLSSQKTWSCSPATAATRDGAKVGVAEPDPSALTPRGGRMVG